MTLYNILKLRAYLLGLLDWKSTGFNWFKNWATICFVSLDDLDYDLWHLGFSQSVRLGGHSFMTYTNKWPIFWPTSPPSPSHYPEKKPLHLLFKKIESANMWQISRTSPLSFCVGVINVYFLVQNNLFPFFLFVADPFYLYFLKFIVKWQAKQNISKPSIHAKLNLPTAHANDCSKVIVHELIRSLKLICLSIYGFVGWVGSMDQWSVAPHK